MRSLSTVWASLLCIFSLSCATTEIHHFASVRVKNSLNVSIGDVSLDLKIHKNLQPEQRIAFGSLLSGEVSGYVQVEVETASEALFGNTAWRQIEDCRLSFTGPETRELAVFDYQEGPGVSGSGVLVEDLSYTIVVEPKGTDIFTKLIQE